MALNVNNKIFVIQVAIQEQKEIPVHSKKQAQIRALLFDKAFTKVPAKYSDYSNIFLAEYIAKLLEKTGMNEYVIELEKDKQPPFRPIYSLEPVELEILKIYIKINLANSFIRPSKSPIGAFILFNKKPKRSFHFCVDF